MQMTTGLRSGGFELANNFNGILQSYGEETVVTEGERIQKTRSFIQPVIEKKISGPWEATPLGRRDTSLFYWFCPEGVTIDRTENAVVTIGGTDYEIKELKPYRFSGRVSHMEGILAIKEADYPDGI